MNFEIGTFVCYGCNTEQKAIRLVDQATQQELTLCGDCLARALQELTGFKMLNMYRTMKVQAESMDPRASVHNTRVVLPKEKRS